MTENDSDYINITRVMKDASQGNFDYLLESLRHLQNVLERRNSRQFPTDWLPYLHENIANREPPSLFHYIILHNRKDVLQQIYEFFLSRVADRYGVVSTIILEAIWLKNQSFQEIGWSLLQNYYSDISNSIYIHRSMIRDETIFAHIADAIQAHKGNPFFERLREDIVSSFKNDNYLFSETWFLNKKAVSFFIENIKEIQFDTDSLQNRFRLYQIELARNEGLRFASGPVLESILPKDIIKHIIDLYIG